MKLLLISIFSLTAVLGSARTPLPATYSEDFEEEDLEEIIYEEGEAEDIPAPLSRQVVYADSSDIDEEEWEPESLPVAVDEELAEEENMIVAASPVSSIQEKTTTATAKIEVDFRQVFAGSPIIYTILFALSVFSLCVWLYSMVTVRRVEFLPPDLIRDLRGKLIGNQFDEALEICVREKHFFCKMLASGILVRKHGMGMMLDTMKAEGKRCTISFWQRIGLLNDVAIIAPMIGLLGTVLGLFYAFYDLNRSIESVSLLFDGLGIAVGTTVGGLIVAIIAMILHSTAKYRLIRVLTRVENEAQTFATLIDTRAPNYLEEMHELEPSSR